MDNKLNAWSEDILRLIGGKFQKDLKTKKAIERNLE
jgi:hypothetical protein